MKQYGILVGCNDHGVEGADLRGCINDLRSFYELLATYFNYDGWEFDFLVDQRNTAHNQRTLIEKIVAMAMPGDIIDLHNSSHGTKVPYRNRIEHAVCAYGYDFNKIGETFVLGSQYQELFAKAKPGVRIYFTNDSCNSGGMMKRGLISNVNRVVKPRFVEQPIDIKWKLEHLSRAGSIAPRALVGDMVDVAYASGCGPRETDYSADVGETDPITGIQHWYGAFSRYFKETVLLHKGKSFQEVIAIEAQSLATNQYDQVPTCYGPGIISRPYNYRD